ncbi:sugar transferase [Pedobacter puniceum]|jgi:lipopolysaccharide/colanic/teichoic acid biosynthesis glycosyltransferase|uniref:Sugar transferase n=1 Tax=Pedobacter puniceum TaxID=2666136 RepID=A0A7K0FKM4_9SPHI|nr:sugar transferase [Pedobacter puniceum]MRX46526.1 sugar transferase [Pedobacter puniceum]
MQFQDFKDSSYLNNPSKISILYYADIYKNHVSETFNDESFEIKNFSSLAEIQSATQKLSINELNSTVLLEVSQQNIHEAVDFIESLKKNWLTRNLIVFFLLTDNDSHLFQIALKLGVSDCYKPSINFNDVKERLRFLTFYKLLRSQVSNISEIPSVEYKIPFSKRVIDIVLSLSALICLSPFFLIIAILIKLDSRGPIFYISKRVGTGYKIFDFYKFRSMRQDADKLVAELANKNQYGDSAFFKIENDPRVTKLGNFLRNTSIDELPQLFNVLKGDMSLVGNRPLPLYEAEQLTTNEWSMRFLGPAGLTGLWQISKRGKKDMSDRERKKLDNFYASNYSIWLDLRIILKTIPALIQKEKV